VRIERHLAIVLIGSMLAAFAAGYYFGLKTGEANGYQNGLNNYAGQDICIGVKLVFSLPECRSVCATECPSTDTVKPKRPNRRTTMEPDDRCLELARHLKAKYPQIEVGDIELAYTIQWWVEKQDDEGANP
jgi:hypothetical protein